MNPFSVIYSLFHFKVLEKDKVGDEARELDGPIVKEEVKEYYHDYGNYFLLYQSLESKSYLARTFGPLNEGSIRGSIITLAASACGSGVMVFPSFCK